MSKQIIIISLILFFYSINNKIFSQVDAGENQEICVNYTTLDASEPPVNYTGKWTIRAGNCVIANIHSQSTDITSIIKGDTKLRWTITDGSDTQYDEVIISNNQTTVAYAGEDDQLCADNTHIAGNIHSASETGVWTVINGTGVLATPNTNETDVSSLSLGANTFRWKISKGSCNSQDDVVITNNTISTSCNASQTTCETYATISAEAIPSGATGIWTVGASSGSPIIASPNSNTTNVTNLGADINTFKWKITKGTCTAYDVTSVTSNTPTTAFAGYDNTVCSSSTILDANNPAQGTGTWTVTGGSANISNPNNYNSEVTNLQQSATTTFKWKIDKAGCTSEDEVEIYYDYFVANAGTDQEICSRSTTLSGNTLPNADGKWIKVGGSATIANDTYNNTEISNLINGTSEFSWTLTRGNCSQSDNVRITNNIAPPASAGENQELCGGTTNMSASNPAYGYGYWTITSGSGTFVNSLDNNTVINNIPAGTNTFRWTINNNGCLSFDEMEITNNINSATAGIDQEVCSFTSQLNGSIPTSSETGTWTVIAGSSTLQNPSVYNTNVSNLRNGINSFRWTVRKGICSAYDDITIVNNKFQAVASVIGSDEVCVDYATISGNNAPAGYQNFWTMISGNGIFDNSLNASTIVRSLDVGINTVKWTTTKNSCTSEASFDITRYHIFAEAGNDQEVCESTTTLSGNSLAGGVTGEWTRISGTANISNPNNNITAVTNLLQGVNAFRWSVSGFGCSDTDDVTVVDYSFNTYAGNNQHTCNNSVTLTANNPAPERGYWTKISGTGTIASPSTFSTQVTDIQHNTENIFRWRTYKNNCTAYDDVTIYNDNIPANAGDDQILCDGSTTLSANSASPGTGTWLIFDGGGNIADLHSNTSAISDIPEGTTILRWVIENQACTTADNVLITNNHLVAEAGYNQNLCQDFGQLHAINPAIGYGVWELVSGNANFVNESLFNTEVSNLASGENVFKWTIYANNCSSEGDLVSITNNNFTVDAGADQDLAQFVTATTFEATLPPNTTGQWSIVAGSGHIEDSGDPHSVVDNMITGINKYKWKVLNPTTSCEAFDYVNIKVVNINVFAGQDSTIYRDSLRMYATDQATDQQTWSLVSGDGTIINPELANTWIKNIPLGTNTYRWSVTINGITLSDDVVITHEDFNVYAGKDSTIYCDSLQLYATDQDADQKLWEANIGDGTFINPNQANSWVKNIPLGLNRYRWTVTKNGVTKYDEVYITREPTPFEISAGKDTIIYESSIQLYASNPDADVQAWDLIEGGGIFDNASLQNTWVRNIPVGINKYRWTVIIDGVSASDDIFVTRREGSKVEYIKSLNYKLYPNPNNGNFNLIFNEDVKNTIIKIYDISGKIIYTSKAKKENFINIENLPQGMYFVNIISEKNIDIVKIIKE